MEREPYAQTARSHTAPHKKAPGIYRRLPRAVFYRFLICHGEANSGKMTLFFLSDFIDFDERFFQFS
jgi:hypothetical protein